MLMLYTVVLLVYLVMIIEYNSIQEYFYLYPWKMFLDLILFLDIL